MSVVAYHNDPQLKAELLHRLEQHAAHDEIAQGAYWQHGKGCAVTCIAYSHDDFLNQLPGGIMNVHYKLQEQWGIYHLFSQVVDAIFEGLPPASAQKWPWQFAEALQPGYDLRKAYHQLWQYILVDDVEMSLHQYAATKDAWLIDHIASLHQAMATTGYLPSDREILGLWDRTNKATGPVSYKALRAATGSITLCTMPANKLMPIWLKSSWEAVRDAGDTYALGKAPAKNWDYQRTTVHDNNSLYDYFKHLRGTILRVLRAEPVVTAPVNEEEIPI